MQRTTKHAPSAWTLLTATALMVGLLVPALPAAAHGSCDTPFSTAKWLTVRSAAPESASISEYLYFVVLQGALEGQRDSAQEVVAPGQGIDAYVFDLNCHRVGGSFEITGSDDDLDQYGLQVRFYDHFANQLGETGCVQTLDGAVPNYTQYVEVVACAGVPASLRPGTNVPYAVRFELSVS